MDDYISRQAAIDAIRASASKYTGFMEMEMYTDDDAVEAINGVPSAQPELITVNIDHELTQEEYEKLRKDMANSPIMLFPSAQQWHVIKKRPMTNDERIEWSERIGYDIEYEDAFIYSNLPDDGEEVLVSSQYGNVYVDKFFQDEVCYFEENGDMDGIVAWMPLPEPYKEGEA